MSPNFWYTDPFFLVFNPRMHVYIPAGGRRGGGRERQSAPSRGREGSRGTSAPRPCRSALMIKCQSGQMSGQMSKWSNAKVVNRGFLGNVRTTSLSICFDQSGQMSLSHIKCLSSCFAKVNSRTNPSRGERRPDHETRPYPESQKSPPASPARHTSAATRAALPASL